MLWDLFLQNNHRVAHKWVYYFPAYERHFEKYVNNSIVFLEIGCGKGGSLPLWSRYFGPLATVVGIDIRPECAAYEDKFCKVRIGSQSDTQFLQSVVDEFGPFDVVLDDGSHRMKDLRASFDFLYPLLKNNGTYFVEDLHACYEERYGGGLKSKDSFIEYCKNMIDLLHTRHPTEQTSFSTMTYSMHFYNNICVFEKKMRSLPNFAIKTGKGILPPDTAVKEIQPVEEKDKAAVSMFAAPGAPVAAAKQNPFAAASRINTLAQRYEAENYLEIGVRRGDTFLAVDMPRKVAVDPAFAFDIATHESSFMHFFSVTSDEFFAELATRPAEAVPLTSAKPGEPLTFDIIYIDGLHTYEQSLRDFEQSLRFSHANTIWLLDDTVPNDPYSAIPDHQKAIALRKQAGLHGGSWHGDVFKTVFALHDRHPEFSYCTLMGGKPQTVVWRHAEGHEPRTPVFSSLEEIARLSYFDMLEHAALLMPVKDDILLDIVGMALDPQKYGEANTWKKLIYRKSLTPQEIQLKKEVTDLKAVTNEGTVKLKKEEEELKKELDRYKAQLKIQKENAGRVTSDFPNLPQKTIVLFLAPFIFLWLTFAGKQKFIYKLWLDPSDFFASPDNPVNAFFRKLLCIFGPPPLKTPFSLKKFLAKHPYLS